MALIVEKFQLASVVLHDLPGKAESQPHSFTHILGSKERFHDL
jgi:hypothetical protein